MNVQKFFLLSLMVMLTSLSHVPRLCAEPAESTEMADPAMGMVNRMAEFLSQAKGFSVTADMGFDAVQESGQKIEFGETRKIVIERPDRLRVEAVKRSGEKSQLTFDGKSLSLYYEKPNVYSTELKSGTVDEILKYFTEELGLRLPLAEMLSSELATFLKGKVREARFVEESSVEGVACDHVALRGEDVDMQVWIAQGAKPLPQRIVIAYNDQEGEPQFWAQFSQWKLAPKASKSFFAFKAPRDAKKIAFSPKQVMPSERTDAIKEEKA